MPSGEQTQHDPLSRQQQWWPKATSCASQRMRRQHERGSFFYRAGRRQLHRSRRRLKGLADSTPGVLGSQLGNKDRRVEFEVMFEELKAWKDTYHTTLVPKQVQAKAVATPCLCLYRPYRPLVHRPPASYSPHDAYLRTLRSRPVSMSSLVICVGVRVRGAPHLLRSHSPASSGRCLVVLAGPHELLPSAAWAAGV